MMTASRPISKEADPDDDLQQIIQDTLEGRRGLHNDQAIIDIIRKNKSAAQRKYIYKPAGDSNEELDPGEKSGMYLPLYIAIRENASLDVVNELCRAYPNAVREMTQDLQGGTLLHCALQYYKSSKVLVPVLLKEWPGAVEVKDNCWQTPLHAACGKYASLEVISLLLGQYPAAVQIQDIHGEVPLHHACSNNAPLEVISLLLDRWPAAGEIIGFYDYTPLHYACNSKSQRREVISLLLEQCPAAVEFKEFHGQTPLHCACNRHTTQEVISLLLDQWPASVKARDNYGRTPLHHACTDCSSPEVISLLLERWPAAVEVKDRDGETPLLTACDNKAPQEVISLLLEQWPASVKVKDDDGMTALHFACFNEDTSVGVIALLVECWPAAVEVKDKDRMIARVDEDHIDFEKLEIMLPGVRSLFKKITQPDAMQIMADFVGIEWWGGVGICFDLFKDSFKLVEDIPLSLIPDLLSMLGSRCKLLTLWNMMRNRQDILKIS